MFKRIIIASELSAFAHEMLDCLEVLRKFGTEECLLLQCVNPNEVRIEMLTYVSKIYERNLFVQKEIVTAMGYKAETRVVLGHIEDEINKIAVLEDYSAIIAATPERALLGEFFYGGIAYEVIHHAKKPVLLIRIPYKPEKECGLEEHILFATDFSENADTAFKYVKELAAAGVKKITVMHVEEIARINEDISHRLEEFNVIDAPEEIEKAHIIAEERARKISEIDDAKLQELKKILVDEGCREVNVQLLYGSPAVEILRLINEQEVTLTVMGSQGRGFVKEFFLGSVSHNIARHSSSSVLLIPALRES